MRASLHVPSNSRRKTSRVEAPEIRVFWTCGPRSDVLRVRNLSFGGAFVETSKPPCVGTNAQIDFMVEEGQLRTTAVVRHIKVATGMGLEFAAVAREGRPHLASLVK